MIHMLVLVWMMRDLVLWNLHEQWLQEDIVTGIMKVGSGTRHVGFGAPSLFGAAMSLLAW